MSTAVASSATDVATPESGYGEVLAARDRVTLPRFAGHRDQALVAPLVTLLPQITAKRESTTD